MNDPRFPTHEEIKIQVRELVNSNIDGPYKHNCESLNDLIADLIQYRDSVPTVQEYLASNPFNIL
jgi:hypothetical protein